MFELSVPWWEIILRTTIIYFFVLFALRITGWRSVGQRNALDLVLILIVANGVQNAMIGSDVSLLGGLIAASTLFALDSILDRLFASHRVTSLNLSGMPRVLVSHGEKLENELRRSSINDEELMEILREHGFDDLSRIKSVVLEMDGTVSVVAEQTPAVVTHRRIHPRRRTEVVPD